MHFIQHKINETLYNNNLNENSSYNYKISGYKNIPHAYTYYRWLRIQQLLNLPKVKNTLNWTP